MESKSESIGNGAPTDGRAARMTLSRVVQMLLERPASGGHTSVALSRNAKGDTQVDVRVAVDGSHIATLDDAVQAALATYDMIAARYPITAAVDGASVALTRNAKGETQITVEAKPSDVNAATLEDAVQAVAAAYDSARCKYPMLDSRTAREGTVA